LIERLGQSVQDSTAGHREATSAARAIRSAGKIDLENISVTIKTQRHEPGK
jgi:hypothetical protein